MSETISYKLPKHLAARRSAQRYEWTVQVVGVSVAIVTFTLAALLVGPINDIRKERQLVINPETVAGLPPGIALLSKTGTFRALAIDWASIRAERLKEEGKTYEALQLHQTICALAPRYPKLWAYASWNMAYNISVSQFTPEARWKWVRNGIEILRDKAIVFNPRSITLYKEMAWTYWHKIGDFLDDEHWNYKRALAVDIERILGPPPITLTNAEYYAWFKKVVDAPRDLDKLLKDDLEVRALVDILEQVKLYPDLSLLEFVAMNIRPELMVTELYAEPLAENTLEYRRLTIIKNPEFKPALERLLATVRSKILREDQKFDLDYMYSMMVDRFGPLDWRNAFSHSLYWSSFGDDRCKGIAGSDPADSMNTARFVFFSLSKLVNRGRMTLYPDFADPFASYVDLSPDTRYIPYVYETYMRLGKEQFGDDPRYIEGTPGPNYMVGFVSSMHNWIHLLYFEGGEKNLALAEQYYTWLREYNRSTNGQIQGQYLTSVEELVMHEIRGQLETYRAAGTIVRTFVRRALKQFSLGQNRQAMTSMIRARQCYDIWMEGTDTLLNDRSALERPRIILRDEIEQFMKDMRYSPLFKARLWKSLPLEQRQMVYDIVRPVFVAICEAQKPRWDVHRAFGEPPGMDAARKNLPDYRAPAHRDDVEEGTRYEN